MQAGPLLTLRVFVGPMGICRKSRQAGGSHLGTIHGGKKYCQALTCGPQSSPVALAINPTCRCRGNAAFNGRWHEADQLPLITIATVASRSGVTHAVCMPALAPRSCTTAVKLRSGNSCHTITQDTSSPERGLPVQGTCQPQPQPLASHS